MPEIQTAALPQFCELPIHQLRESDTNPRKHFVLAARPRQPLDPVAILNSLADGRIDDIGFWVLTSAAAHLNGYDLNDGCASTVATLMPERAHV